MLPSGEISPNLVPLVGRFEKMKSDRNKFTFAQETHPFTSRSSERAIAKTGNTNIWGYVRTFVWNCVLIVRKSALGAAKTRFTNCFRELEMASIVLSLKWRLCKCSHGGLKNMVHPPGLGEVRLGQNCSG